MTELQMVVVLSQSFALFAASFPYFIILSCQIYLLCYTGNELTFAVSVILTTIKHYLKHFLSFSSQNPCYMTRSVQIS